MGRYGEVFYGSKYKETRGKTTTEIAKMFREDVKAAQKAGDLPRGLKLSVKTRYFSGGSAIDVKIVAVPQGFRVLNPAWVVAQAADPHHFLPERNCPAFTAEAENLLVAVKAMIDAYNMDGSDSSVDYYCVRFYGSTE